jgi:hypothetical protein
VVVAERPLVLAQTQTAQPSPDVHPRPPSRARSPASSLAQAATERDRTDGRATFSPVAGRKISHASDGGRPTSEAGVPVLA